MLKVRGNVLIQQFYESFMDQECLHNYTGMYDWYVENVCISTSYIMKLHVHGHRQLSLESGIDCL